MWVMSLRGQGRKRRVGPEDPRETGPVLCHIRRSAGVRGEGDAARGGEDHKAHRPDENCRVQGSGEATEGWGPWVQGPLELMSGNGKQRGPCELTVPPSWGWSDRCSQERSRRWGEAGNVLRDEGTTAASGSHSHCLREEEKDTVHRAHQGLLP